MAKVTLTVDESTSLRQMVKFALSGGGYTVIEAADGRDALSKLTSPVNLVITEGKAAGATGWIVKPSNKQQLLAVVKRVIG